MSSCFSVVFLLLCVIQQHTAVIEAGCLAKWFITWCHLTLTEPALAFKRGSNFGSSKAAQKRMIKPYSYILYSDSFMNENDLILKELNNICYMIFQEMCYSLKISRLKRSLDEYQDWKRLLN